MRKRKKYRYLAAFGFLGISVALLLIFNICIGSVRITLTDIFSVINGQQKNEAITRILLDIRFPRIAADIILGGALALASVRITLTDIFSVINGQQKNEAITRILLDIRFPRIAADIILGGALALAGYLLQTFFHNPIAGPFVLGISSGAKMVVALLMVFLMERAVRVTSVDMIAAAFLGAMLSMGFVLLFSRRVQGMSMLVVSGVMIGYICSAITELAVTFAEDADIVNLHNWSQGSFSGMTWDNVKVMAVVVAVSFIAVFFLSKSFAAYQLGEVYARNMGINIRLLRICLVVLSSILSACIVAFAGPISFVGIATPQLIKKLLGTTKPILMIPACFLGGSVFCLFCDLLARTLLAPTELSISTVTAIFGAPVVLWVMAKKKERNV